MTLRNVAAVADMKVPKERTETVVSSALVFLVNKEFLPGLKVLVYSLIANQTLLDLPIIAISNEPEVMNDPLIQAMSDRPVVLSDDDISTFSAISGDRVPERVRLNWIAKFTLLKWMTFEDYGYDQHIFIDADILCLRNIDDLLGLTDAEFYAAPRFTDDLFKDGERVRSPDDRTALIQAFVNDDHAGNIIINSGVFVANKPLLNSKTRRSLIEYASHGEFITEQKVLRERQAERVNGIRTFSPLYNFHHGYLKYVAANDQLGLANQIKLLHYVGSRAKPWQAGASNNIQNSLWASYAKESRERSSIFSDFKEFRDRYRALFKKPDGSILEKLRGSKRPIWIRALRKFKASMSRTG